MEPYSILAETRKTFKDRCRLWAPSQWEYNFIWPSLWLVHAMLRGMEHCYLAQYRDQFYLLRKGKIVWGCLVQANIKMFEPGTTNHPAVLVYSVDPSFDQDLCELKNIAQYLFSLKEKTLEHPEFSDVKILADAITNERDSLFNVEIPRTLTNNKQVYYTTFMFERKHLPGRCVNHGYFPILVAPARTSAMMVLPSRYWAKPFRAAW